MTLSSKAIQWDQSEVLPRSMQRLQMVCVKMSEHHCNRQLPQWREDWLHGQVEFQPQVLIL